jgi:hypothetical protein
MQNGFEEFQKIGKNNVEAAVKSFGEMSKGFQAIATEIADYSKKAFEDGTAAAEQVMSSKSIDKAVEAQSSFLRTSYEGYVGQATKIGELYVGAAKEAYKPIETVVQAAQKVAK